MTYTERRRAIFARKNAARRRLLDKIRSLKEEGFSDAYISEHLHMSESAVRVLARTEETKE